MKKPIIAAVLMAVFGLVLTPAGRFHGSISGNYFFPSDEDYRALYGKSRFYPELKLGIRLTRGLYLWLGYGFLSAEGVIPIVEENAESNQHHLSAGAGYEFSITRSLKFRIEAGSHNVYYIEKTQFNEQTGLAAGFRGDAGFYFFIGKNIFLGLCAGYLRAAKTVNSNAVTFGGLVSGLAIGFRL